MKNPFKEFWNWIRNLDKIIKMNEDYDSLLVKYNELLDKVNISELNDQREEYWNSKWAIANVIYTAREDSIKFDVRNFITYPDALLKDVINRNSLKGETEYDTIFNIINWVNSNVTYVTDDKQFGFQEQWDFPAEVLSRKKADCEGFSHLIISLCRNAEIPAYKLKVVCGTVDAGGHSYPIYLRDDDEWVAIEGAYYPNKFPIKDRVPVKEDKKYNPIEEPIWFTFNDQYSFAQSNLIVKPGDV